MQEETLKYESRSEVEEADDQELLLLLYDFDNDAPQAERSLKLLIARHGGFLESVCKKNHWFGSDYPAADLVLDVFTELYRKQPDFAPQTSDVDGEAIARSFRRWLCGICKNLYLNYLDTLPVPFTVVPHVEDLHPTLPEFGDVTPLLLGSEDAIQVSSKRRSAIMKFIEELKETDRIILVFSLDYLNRDTGEFELRQKDAQRLSKLVEKSTAAIRQQRGRIIKRLRSHLEEPTTLDK